MLVLVEKRLLHVRKLREGTVKPVHRLLEVYAEFLDLLPVFWLRVVYAEREPRLAVAQKRVVLVDDDLCLRRRDDLEGGGLREPALQYGGGHINAESVVAGRGRGGNWQRKLLSCTRKDA